MIKKIISLFILIFCFLAHANITTCFRDAQFIGHVDNPQTLSDECSLKLLENESTLYSVSPTGKKVFGLANLIYVPFNGNLSPIAGNETHLRNIIFLRYDENNDTIIVFQRINNQTSYSFFNSKYPGNVRPFVYNSDPSYDELSNIILFPKEDEIVQIFEQQGKVILMNMNADTRTIFEKDHRFKKSIKRVLNASSGLKSPKFVARDSDSKQIFIYDSDQILVFAEDDSKPKKIIPAPNRSQFTEMQFDKATNRLLFYVGNKQLTPISLAE